jgi:hypothetical protein
MLNNVRESCPDIWVEHRDLDPLHIVDWKSPDQNLNPYNTLNRHHAEYVGDPFDVLAGRYSDDALEDMRAHYGLVVA